MIEGNGGHQGTRTPALYRVNFEVTPPKPFPHLAFPQSEALKTGPKPPGFDGELMASSSTARSTAAIASFLRQRRLGSEATISRFAAGA